MSARVTDICGTTAERLSAVDRLVLATVNAPYHRNITAEILATHLARAELNEWTVHIANFFTDVSPELIFAFAELHQISASKLALAYAVMKSATGEANSDLESALASLAPTA